jgi:hypothetical protein
MGDVGPADPSTKVLGYNLASLRDEEKAPVSDNFIAALTDPDADKYELLERTLAEARFFEQLEAAWRTSGKDRAEFKIALKPNLGMLLRRADIGTYTDTGLVVHLLRLLLLRGFTNLAVVESQNLYGNWFQNRGVIQVGARAGYFDESAFAAGAGERSHDVIVRGGGVSATVPLIDLTHDLVEHQLTPAIGPRRLARTWLDADFRINFPKFKTHFYSYYTLAVKNIYGCLPEQNKVKEYHCRRAVGPWTAQLIKSFPVHFTIVDGYSGADGWFGVKVKAIFTKPHLFLAGPDVAAIDDFGARLMGLNPRGSVLFRELIKLMPLRPYRVIGNASPLRGWRNPLHVQVLATRALETNAYLMELTGQLATGGNDPCFPAKAATSPRGKIRLALARPTGVFMDLGSIRLGRRKRHFRERLRAAATRLPLIAGSEAIGALLIHLSAADLGRLAEIMARHELNEVSCSGHYLIIDGAEIAYPARMFSANLAAMELMRLVRESGLDRKALAAELALLGNEYPNLIGPGGAYPFCFR